MKPCLLFCEHISVNTEMTECVGNRRVLSSAGSSIAEKGPGPQNTKGQSSANFQHPKERLPITPWLALAGLPLITFFFRDFLPAWLFMWLMAFAIFMGCKWLAWRRAQAATGNANLWSLLAYFLLWPGMDAEAFQ